MPMRTIETIKAPTTVRPSSRSKPSTKSGETDLAPDAYARFFDQLHEGVYIGAIESASTRTFSANPHLKLMFGFAADTPERDIRPFDG